MFGDQLSMYVNLRRNGTSVDSDSHTRFLMRNSLYGMNPNPPTVEELESIGAFTTEDKKESK